MYATHIWRSAIVFLKQGPLQGRFCLCFEPTWLAPCRWHSSDPMSLQSRRIKHQTSKLNCALISLSVHWDVTETSWLGRQCLSSPVTKTSPNQHCNVTATRRFFGLDQRIPACVRILWRTSTAQLPGHASYYRNADTSHVYIKGTPTSMLPYDVFD